MDQNKQYCNDHALEDDTLSASKIFKTVQRQCSKSRKCALWEVKTLLDLFGSTKYDWGPEVAAIAGDTNDERQACLVKWKVCSRSAGEPRWALKEKQQLESVEKATDEEKEEKEEKAADEEMKEKEEKAAGEEKEEKDDAAVAEDTAFGKDHVLWVHPVIGRVLELVRQAFPTKNVDLTPIFFLFGGAPGIPYVLEKESKRSGKRGREMKCGNVDETDEEEEDEYESESGDYDDEEEEGDESEEEEEDYDDDSDEDEESGEDVDTEDVCDDETTASSSQGSDAKKPRPLKRERGGLEKVLAAKNVASKRQTARQAGAKKGTPKKGTPKKGTPKKGTPKKETPKKGTPKKGSPKKRVKIEVVTVDDDSDVACTQAT
eukprot:3272312-Rhodomonas_salina.1